MKTLFMLFLGIFTVSGWATSPNLTLTPGVLCSPTDPNFDAFYYREHIARCKRNVLSPEKASVAKEYNLPRTQYATVEFDHLIPLCAGGSDNIKNLWPQPIAEAHKKDVVEDFVCKQMDRGLMTQAEAVAMIWKFFKP